jgi:hypothetical protein
VRRRWPVWRRGGEGTATAEGGQWVVSRVGGGGCIDVGRGEEGDGVTLRKEVPWRRRSQEETPRKEMGSHPCPIM